jgi:geranylgeranyl diphosphate synthase type I
VLTRVGAGRQPCPAELSQVSDLVHAIVVPRLHAAVDRLPAPVRDVAYYHLGWCPKTGEPDGTPGKLIRPALTLLSAAAVGGTVEQAADAAVGIELVHNFALLHDDVMDGALVRRHRETVWWRYGMPKAILAGDALLTLGMELFAAMPGAVTIVCAALQELVHGHYRDISFEERDQVSVAECLAVAGAKTAALLRCACELGALQGGGRPAQVLALKQFGWHLGLAFQLTDDLLGIWGDPRETGRAALTDLRAGRKTLPVVAALVTGGPRSAELADLYLRPEPLDDLDLHRVAALIAQAGGRSWARTAAEQQCQAALAALAAADPDADASDALAALAIVFAHRAE